MNATELRIGNYYDHHGEVKTVTPNTILEVWEAQRKWCAPIPLTEEWLLKFGFGNMRDSEFENINMKYCAKNGVLLFYNEGRTEYETMDYYAGFGEMRYGKYYAVCFRWIKYVHQLQNLYFALTGTELTIS